MLTFQTYLAGVTQFAPQSCPLSVSGGKLYKWTFWQTYGNSHKTQRLLWVEFLHTLLHVSSHQFFPTRYFFVVRERYPIVYPSAWTEVLERTLKPEIYLLKHGICYMSNYDMPSETMVFQCFLAYVQEISNGRTQWMDPEKPEYATARSQLNGVRW